GYSGFIKYSDALMRGYEAWPTAASIDLFRSAGATHLTYNCAFESTRPRCASTLEHLDANPALELIASGRWLGQETRLYRIKRSSVPCLYFGARTYVRVDEVDDLLHGAAGQEDSADADLLQLRDVHVGDDAADDDEDIAEPLVPQQLHDARADVH